MKDIKGFCKLFDLNIPTHDEFEYYVDILSRIEKFKNIRDLISMYEFAEDNIPGDLYDYRFKKANDCNH